MRAEYGSALLKNLSIRLAAELGTGFDEHELRRMRQFYVSFPIRDALRPELAWTHYRLLFASKYRLYLPTEEALREELERERAMLVREQPVRYRVMAAL